MRKLHRLFALVLVLACLLSLIPGAALAADRETQPRTAQNDKLIALTFDDGPGKDTARLLDALRARDAHCTFFMVGYCAKARPSVVKQCYEDGHQIASHTYDHPQLTKLTDAEIKKQLADTAAVLDSAIGAHNTYMVRPPYGSYNTRVLNALGVPAFYWSDDSGDWKVQDANVVYNNVIATAGEGDILLLHDSHSWSVDAAIRVVDKLQAEGYEFVTLSELFRRRGKTLEAGEIYFYLRATGTNLPAIQPPKLQVVYRDGKAYGEMTADPGTTIHYTLDGTIPNAASPVYTEPLPLGDETLNITAVAGYDMNGSRSAPSRATLHVEQCKTPLLEISKDGLVTITGEETLCYTLDGSAPHAQSPRYTEPFRVEPGTLVRAISCQPGGEKTPSPYVSMCYSHHGFVFADVLTTDWFYAPMDEAKARGLVKGVDPTHMAPMEPTTRAMLAQTLYRLAGTPKVKVLESFSDVAPNAWFAKAVAWAKETRVIRGYPGGTFLPENLITREETVTMLERFAAAQGYDTGAEADLGKYEDGDLVTPYARHAMAWAIDTGLIKGVTKTTLAPHATTSRAELAILLLRFAQKAQTWEKIEP